VHEKTGARPGRVPAGFSFSIPTQRPDRRLSVQRPMAYAWLSWRRARAGRGCLCPETALISSAVAGMHLHDEDVWSWIHMPVEHLGAPCRGFDSVVWCRTNINSVQVGVESAALAHELVSEPSIW